MRQMIRFVVASLALAVTLNLNPLDPGPGSAYAQPAPAPMPPDPGLAPPAPPPPAAAPAPSFDFWTVFEKAPALLSAEAVVKGVRYFETDVPDGFANLARNGEVTPETPAKTATFPETGLKIFQAEMPPGGIGPLNAAFYEWLAARGYVAAAWPPTPKTVWACNVGNRECPAYAPALLAAVEDALNKAQPFAPDHVVKGRALLADAKKPRRPLHRQLLLASGAFGVLPYNLRAYFKATTADKFGDLLKVTALPTDPAGLSALTGAKAMALEFGKAPIEGVITAADPAGITIKDDNGDHRFAVADINSGKVRLFVGPPLPTAAAPVPPPGGTGPPVPPGTTIIRVPPWMRLGIATEGFGRILGDPVTLGGWAAMLTVAAVPSRYFIIRLDAGISVVGSTNDRATNAYELRDAQWAPKLTLCPNPRYVWGGTTGEKWGIGALACGGTVGRGGLVEVGLTIKLSVIELVVGWNWWWKVVGNADRRFETQLPREYDGSGLFGRAVWWF